MTQTSTETTAAPVPTAAASLERDPQRTALRDLVSLSAEASAREAEIERNHQEELARFEKELAQSLADLQNRLRASREKMQQKVQERLAEIESQFQEEFSALEKTDKASRRRADHDLSNVETEIKQKLEQAAWMADSLLEGTQNQLKVEARQAKELYDTQNEAMDALDGRMTALMKKYGQVVNPNDYEPIPFKVKPEEAAATYAKLMETAELQLKVLAGLKIPRLFVGVTPFLAFIGLCGAAGFAGQLYSGNLTTPAIKEILMSAGAMFGVLVVVAFVLRMIGIKHIQQAYVPLRQTMDHARRASRVALEYTRQTLEERQEHARRNRDREIDAVKNQLAPMREQARRNRQNTISSMQLEYTKQLARLEGVRDNHKLQLEEWKSKHEVELAQRHEQMEAEIRQKHDQAIAASDEAYNQARAALENDWNQGLARIQEPIESATGSNGQALVDWESAGWANWKPPRDFVSQVRFGEFHVDLAKITDQVPQQLRLPESFSVPATLTFPANASLLIHSDHAGRAESIATLRMVMARLLTSLPPGRVRFTIIDPVGLGQNFAGFMHLADHDEALVGARIWTETEHIEERLANLTEHMETVIQKYLRNEFATIDEYNAQAGELAEPYRFLVIADFPVGFEGDAFRRLNSIASTGARCGVYTLVVRDTRQSLPQGVHLDELQTHSINLVREDGRFVWKDEVFKQFPLTVDRPPADETLTKLLDVVGRHAKEASRIEVPFETIAPKPEEFWTRSAKSELAVPVGRLGATRLQSLRLGKGVAQHVLIAGKTGSGKSTLLHALVTNLAMWYSPDEVEFYLVDFKKGVEFKTYATNLLPHARAIAVESDREFGLSVLQRIDAELTRRGDLFRMLGVQDLAAYRDATGGKDPMPRTLLIIDEFQEFFSEDDKLAQDASVLLDRLVRQGRAFGIHVLLGSQTIGGSSGLARSTIGQMAVRIALQTSEADSQLILGDNNSAARLLSRPGEAIYNDAGGLVEGNSPFQVAWLPDEQRDAYLSAVAKRVDGRQRPEPVVFEGNAPADITKNRRLESLLEKPAENSLAPVAWLGEPVAIKDPTAVVFRRQAGANLLLIGQQEESAMAIFAAALAALALQSREAKLYMLDGTPADSPLSGTLARVAQAIGGRAIVPDYRAAPDAINDIAKELEVRQATEQHGAPIFLCIFGLQRYRVLRKSEDSFSFGSDDGDKPPAPDKQFADILREGPALGIHVIAYADTAASVDRTLDRSSMREFDHRVLFQMSATDSSNLIDSPAANKLGFHRALAYSEEQGTIEKFRPYAVVGKTWLERLSAALAS